MEKTMTVKNRDISYFINTIKEYQKSLTEANIYVDPRIAYLFGRNLRILENEFQDFDNAKADLLQQYGSVKTDPDEPNKTYYAISKIENPENYEIFLRELDKLSNIEHEITLFTENFDEFDNPFTFEDLCSLWFLLDKE